MDLRNFFAELKRRNIYKVAVAYGVVAQLLIQVATLHHSLKSSSVLGACQSRCPLHPKRESRHHVNG